jgi:hypothetical protein
VNTEGIDVKIEQHGNGTNSVCISPQKSNAMKMIHDDVRKYCASEEK